MISVPICSLPSIRSNRARSTFRIFPRSGSTAWFARLRPCFADPPALSPSTRKISAFAGSFSWQSASFPGRFATSIAVLRRVRSRALRAASRATAASTILPTTSRASPGFSSNHSASFSFTSPSTAGRTSELTSLSLVWLRELRVRHLHRQARRSAPPAHRRRVSATFSRFASPDSPAYALTVRVNAPRNPARCVPPSRCGMLLVNGSTVSW